MRGVGAVPSVTMSQSQWRRASEAGWQPETDTCRRPVKVREAPPPNQSSRFNMRRATHIKILITSSSSEDCGGVTSGVGSGGLSWRQK